jgi:hypothetical protein
VLGCSGTWYVTGAFGFVSSAAADSCWRSSSREGFLERIKAGFKTKILKLGDWTAFVMAE